MSHFITLTHVYVEQDIVDEIDYAFRLKRELHCKAIKQKLQEKPDDFMLQFWLKEAQHPANELERAVEAEIDEKLKPFSEQIEDPEYLEFTDMTEECQTRYEKDTVTAVRFSNGRIVSEYDNSFYKHFVIRDGLVYEKNWGQLKHEKRSKAAKSITVLPNYPVKKLYKDLDAFATDNLGYRYDDDEEGYGYYSNPNAFYDWYSIGGRWPYIFLVDESCRYAIASTDERGDAPEGFRWVCGARKRDIRWELMKELKAEAAKKNFALYEEWFRDGKTPKEFFGNVTDEGICSWQDMVYLKDESEAEFPKRNGLAPDDRYLPDVYAYLQNGEYHSGGDIGWFGISMNDKPQDEWRKMLAGYFDSLSNDAIIVGVDCHI